MKYPKILNTLAALLGIFSLFLFYLVVAHRFNLEEIQAIFSIIGSVSIGIAIATYFYKQHQDVTIAAIEQISFFREEILQEDHEFMEEVRSKNPEFTFRPIRLDEPSIEVVKKKFPEEVRSQMIFLEDPDFLSRQTQVLNMLEELALRIKHFNTYDHEALVSIKAAFVALVERYALALLHQRFVLTGLPTYSNVLEVYSKWIILVDRRDPKERIKEFSR